MKQMIDIYRSGRKEGMYLYVPRGSKLEELPEALLKQFGRAEHAMALLLTPDKKLARANASTVLQSLEDKGFYLQMPPQADDYMGQIPNDKLSRG